MLNIEITTEIVRNAPPDCSLEYARLPPSWEYPDFPVREEALQPSTNAVPKASSIINHKIARYVGGIKVEPNAEIKTTLFPFWMGYGYGYSGKYTPAGTLIDNPSDVGILELREIAKAVNSNSDNIKEIVISYHWETGSPWNPPGNKAVTEAIIKTGVHNIRNALYAYGVPKTVKITFDEASSTTGVSKPPLNRTIKYQFK